ncbi:MAG: hypothetical protein EPO13_00590 [Actinomycetota bacterium]|nr:MAG: hypothetical protein EPO13_00590 [Actinomycetota bacterium]
MPGPSPATPAVPAARPRRTTALAGVAATAVAASLLVPVLPAAAAPAPSTATTVATANSATPVATALSANGPATKGLFGAQDPTYDGVYRQSLAILGLVAADSAVPTSAIDWLVRQQCADGGFVAFRADLTAPCPATDLATFTGEDTNSTAAAALALAAVGRSGKAARAIGWVKRAQNPDGGFPYYDGGQSDANSTGIVLSAFRGTATPVGKTKTNGKNGAAFLRTVALGCAAGADAGALAYQGPAPLLANAYATAQGLAGLTTALPRPAQPVSKVTPNACAGTAAAGTTVAMSAAGWLARTLNSGNGTIPNAFGPGTDWNTTAYSVLSLVGSGYGRTAVKKATTQLAQHVSAYATDLQGQASAGALGTLLLVTDSRNLNPKNFGGVNLITTLKTSRRR